MAQAEKGRPMFTVVPLSKHGYDGCSHLIMSANMQDHIVKRNASFGKAIELGLQLTP